VKEDGDAGVRARMLGELREDRQSEGGVSYAGFLQYLKECLAGVGAS
jgi:hypothetical protein